MSKAYGSCWQPARGGTLPLSLSLSLSVFPLSVCVSPSALILLRLNISDDRYGTGPLYNYLSYGTSRPDTLEMIYLLLQNGADPAQCTHGGKSALELLVCVIGLSSVCED